MPLTINLKPKERLIVNGVVIENSAAPAKILIHNTASLLREKDILTEEQASSPARLCDIVAATLSLIQTVIRHDQITLTVAVPADLPAIRCRSQQIQQVLMNLLTNARDALNQRYPGHDANKRVIVSARQLPKAIIRLTVEDHGSGIPEELRTRIFDPFFSTKPRDQGTGLGLSISHGIVKDHGGELTVESEVGQWTRFHVDLPVGE